MKVAVFIFYYAQARLTLATRAQLLFTIEIQVVACEDSVS